MTSAKWAYGSKLQLGDGATPTEVFTSIAEITEMNIFALERDEIDVTSYGSANGFREFIPGMRDGGSVEITANWLAGNATQNFTVGLGKQFNDDVLHNFKIVTAGGIGSVATVAVSGFVTKYEVSAGLEEQYVLSCTIKISGKPTVSVA